MLPGTKPVPDSPRGTRLNYRLRRDQPQPPPSTRRTTMMMSSVLVSMMISQFKVVIQSRRWDHGGPRMQARDIGRAAAIGRESDRDYARCTSRRTFAI